MDRKVFFDAVRSPVFSGKMSSAQVKGVNALIDACFAYEVTEARQMAYVLATPVIETGNTFKPIVENLNYSEEGLRRTFPKYFPAAKAKLYARKPEAIANCAYANRMGNGDESTGDGWKYRGRGYCQITGKDNYSKFSKLLDIDLVSKPDLALDPEIAAKIIVIGMRDGMFTGVKLSDYFTSKTSDWVNARRIINGLDRAGDIAEYAQKFHKALVKSNK